MVWRVSLAEVTSDGPFSRFEGVDRVIMLAHGNGFELRFEDGRVQVIDTPFSPFAFAGELGVHCRLLNGPVRDLNLMRRRGAQSPGLVFDTLTHATTIVAPGEALSVAPTDVVLARW